MASFELKDRAWKVVVGDATTGVARSLVGLDVDFDIKKTLYPEPNSCSLTVFNMAPDFRRQLEQLNLYDPKKVKGANQNATVGDSVQKRSTSVSRAPKTGNIRVEIFAGYKDVTPLVFRGDLRRAISKHSGPEVATEIEGEDGGRSILSSRVTMSFPSNTELFEVVRNCADAMGVGLGNIREVREKLRAVYSHGTTLNGSADLQLKQALRRANLTYSVQDGVLHFHDPAQGQIVRGALVDEAHGLVLSPERDATGALIVTMLMIPEIHPGAYIQLKSKDYSGAYLIKAVNTKGSSYGNDWYHICECWPA